MGLPAKKENEGTLVIHLDEGTWVEIGSVVVYLEEVRGAKARLIIQADRSILVLRQTAKNKAPRNGQAMPNVQQNQK